MSKSKYEKEGAGRREATFTDSRFADARPDDTAVDAIPNKTLVETPDRNSPAEIEEQIKAAKQELAKFTSRGKEQRGHELVDVYDDPKAQAIQEALAVLRNKKVKLQAPQREVDRERFIEKRRWENWALDAPYEPVDPQFHTIAPGDTRGEDLKRGLKEIEAERAATKKIETLDIKPPSLRERFKGLFKKK